MEATNLTNRDIADACDGAARQISYNDEAQGRAKHMLHEAAGRLRRARAVNCDQVAWMLAAIDRCLPPQDAPRVSRARAMQSYALLYELMDVAGLVFEDDVAAGNATPADVQRLRLKPSGLQAACQSANTAGSGRMVGGIVGTGT